MMQPCSLQIRRTLTGLLSAMEADAAQRADSIEDQRSESREPLHAECELCYFPRNGEFKIVYDAIARNVTFMGISIVAPLPQPIEMGRPVEAIVKAPNHTNTYIAGTVAFCRQVDDECHEIGISVMATSHAPILMGDVEAAESLYEWFATALTAPE